MTLSWEPRGSSRMPRFVMALAARRRSAAMTSGDQGRTSAANRLRQAADPTQAVLQVPHAIDRSREEFELIRTADVPGPSAVDHAVSIEEHGRTVHGLRPVRQAVSFHAERATRVRRLEEEIDESPLCERVPCQRE